MAGTVVYLIILFSNCIETCVPFGNYLDEAVFLLMLLLTAVKLLAKKNVRRGWNKYDVYLLAVLGLFYTAGIISTLLNGDGVPRQAVIKDVVLSGKFFLTYLCGRMVFLTADRKRMFRFMRAVTRAAVAVIFVCGVISLFVNIGMGDQIRFGFRSYQFLFTHYTFLVYAETVMIAVLYTGLRRKNRKYIVMAMISMLFTLRTKAVVFCVVILLFSLLEKTAGRIRLRYYAAAGAAGFAAAWGKIRQYISWGFSYNMRNGLYMAGLRLASEYFPFGVGFAGFGSNLSYEYSPQIYYRLGLNSYQGFENGTPVLSDVFWPYIYGEFGAAGLACYIAMLVLLFFSIRQELEEEEGMFRGANCIFVYLLLASAAEAVFTNSSGVFSALLLGVFFRRNRAAKQRPGSRFIIRI